ncbi:hypothetical protein GY996_21935, partial [Escherichia coli]|nr:hypothetical protein [Escherichia coli]NWQ24938.1 hypothetical protein [Escherichia coli]
MSYSSFKIILIHVKNIIPIITATLILNYLNNSERSLEGANKQVISSQADSLIKISRIWADF